MRMLFVAAAALALAGCGPSRQQVAAMHDQECISYGAQPGSQEYFQCRMLKGQQASNEDMVRRQIAAQALSNAARDIQRNQPVYAPPPQLGGFTRSSPTRCVSKNVFGQIVTECN